MGGTASAVVPVQSNASDGSLAFRVSGPNRPSGKYFRPSGISLHHRDFLSGDGWPFFIAPPVGNGEAEVAATFGLLDLGLRTSRLPFCIP